MVACEAVGRVGQMCASEVSLGPVDDQSFEVMNVGRDGQNWREVVDLSDDRE